LGDLRLDNWLIVIPARLGSTRLPQKPLQDLAGKPLVVRVYENLAPLAAQGATLVVATDDDTVVKTCAKFSIKAVLTDTAHASGTDRCHEVSLGYPHPYILNVQGDEPFIDCTDLTSLMSALSAQSLAGMATLAFESCEPTGWSDPNTVKLVCDRNGMAMYFSRSGLPYDRERKGPPVTYLQHIGVYAFSRQALHDFCQLPPSALEQRECLEQLRALEAGFKIIVVPAKSKHLGIDTPEDLEVARGRFR